MVHRQASKGLLFGLPVSLVWGFVAIAVFMTGDGIELAFLSRYVVDLGFSPTQASLLFTVYGLLAALSSWSSGVLAETFGPRRIMLIGVAAWIVFHALFLAFGLQGQNYVLMVLFYGIRGLAYPLFIYAFMVWIAQVTPGARMASAMGWFWSMYCLGIGFFGTWLPSLSLSRIGFIGTLWMAIFWVALAGAMIMLLVKEHGAGRPGDAVTLGERLKNLSQGVTVIVERRGMLLIVLVRIICNLSLFGLPVIMPLYLTSAEVGFSMEQWLHLWGVMFAVSIFTNVIWGQIGDRLGWLVQMRWFGCIGCALSSLAFYYLPQVYGAHFGMALIAAVTFALSVTAFVPMGAVFLALAPEQKGAAISAHNLAAGLSNFMGPAIATLFIATLGIKGVLWIYAALYAIGAVLTFFIPVQQPRLGQAASVYTHSAEPVQTLQ
ncbi:MFS transporter [Pseudomonas chlororaphis]|uniref:Cytochrome C biogenesis protein CcdA n=1 Tax=Pseudomonas chlororaphis TaxID=587753 RepID=A0A1Q8ES47_9PSED|nr:MFS transporter [Pseudomonas chlororaphis]OLF54611.1 cytochrome C biogenesis protein CcdA [Pseudomonas chlororaphis]